jgi:hypothetical protein
LAGDLGRRVEPEKLRTEVQDPISREKQGEELNPFPKFSLLPPCGWDGYKKEENKNGQ